MMSIYSCKINILCDDLKAASAAALARRPPPARMMRADDVDHLRAGVCPEAAVRRRVGRPSLSALRGGGDAVLGSFQDSSS
jgi:hypothetical protein